jgi:hypothetical protein
MATIMAIIAALSAVPPKACKRVANASGHRPVDRRSFAISYADKNEDRDADDREQDGRSEIGLRRRRPGQPASHGHRGQRNHHRRCRSEQHAHSGDERAVALIRADPRGHGEIGHVHRRISRAEKQMRAEDARDGPRTAPRRRQIGEDEAKSERNGTRRHDRPVAQGCVPPVDEHARNEARDSVPHGCDHVGRRRDRNRDVERVRVVEQEKEHDALPVNIEREVPECEQQQPRFGWTRGLHQKRLITKSAARR